MTNYQKQALARSRICYATVALVPTTTLARERARSTDDRQDAHGERGTGAEDDPGDAAGFPEGDCPCRHALGAIAADPKMIRPAQTKLAPIVSKYLK
jgi:hypothetical protein